MAEAMMSHFAGKTAIVLGASAEGGTGWAIAEAFAEAGANVVVGARSLPALERLADKIRGTAVSCDAGNEAQVRNLAETALRRYGRLDIAVNAAGLPVMGMIADSTDDALQSALQVNYFGNVYFVKHMAKAMGTDGAITLISSMSTTHPLVPHFAYACAKSATDCLVRYAALEYGPQNIRVNSILAGAIVSDMSRELFANKGVRSAFEKEIPLGRLGYPADFVNSVLWLSGPAYVTGINLQVNGGNHLTRFPYLNELPAADQAYEGTGKPLFDR
jgi:NAD(P)-dependent dehydrogenase (short-subunit alcohol dehydrogenase family)